MRLFLLSCLMGFTVVSASADAVTDAKRKAANDLMREGKSAEAISLIQEVIKADATNFKDHLLLARAYDKANNGAEAVKAYKAVLDLVPTSSTGAEERAARAEADRRLKILDQMTAKIRAAEDDFLKRLEALEKEAITAKDLRATERAFRLKAAIYHVQGRTDAGGFDVIAATDWQESRVMVTKGQRYRIRAVGSWDFGGKLQCGPDGAADGSLIPGTEFVRGSLVANVQSTLFPVKSNYILTAPADGQIVFMGYGERPKSKGSVFVLIEPLN